jgi:UPF0755 protein
VAPPRPERVLVGAGGLAEVEPSRSSVFDLEALASHPPAEPPGAEWVRLPSRSGPLRRALIVIAVVGTIVAVIAFSVIRWVDRQIHPSGPQGAAVEFTIEQGQTTNVVAGNLAEADIVGNATVFRYWLRRQGGDQTFKAGDYDLFKRMDYPDLLTALRAGPKPPVQFKVTIPPGLTVTQMATKIREQMPSFNDEELAQAFAQSRLDPPWAPPGASREGELFADTYNIDEDASGNEFAFLKRLRDQMDKVLKDVNAEPRAAELGYSVYDVVKVASLIEEEAKVDADRAKIARVIYNRLDRGMTLGIDATTRYAAGKVNGEPLTQDDLDADNPFNTRKVKGLPPTPISSPSKKSIEAALAPTPDQKWLYYVLTDDAGVKGAHTFANTASEFNAAKKICVEKGYC